MYLFIVLTTYSKFSLKYVMYVQNCKKNETLLTKKNV